MVGKEKRSRGVPKRMHMQLPASWVKRKGGRIKYILPVCKIASTTLLPCKPLAAHTVTIGSVDHTVPLTCVPCCPFMVNDEKEKKMFSLVRAARNMTGRQSGEDGGGWHLGKKDLSC